MNSGRPLLPPKQRRHEPSDVASHRLDHQRGPLHLFRQVEGAGLGLLRRDLGDTAAAEAAFLAALRDDASHWHAAYNLVRLYLAQARHDEARRLLLTARQRAMRAGDSTQPVDQLLTDLQARPDEPSAPEATWRHPLAGDNSEPPHSLGECSIALWEPIWRRCAI